MSPNFAIFTSYPKHYAGYIRESLSDLGVLDYASNDGALSFFLNYSGCVLCFHASDANKLTRIKERQYKIVLLSHQVLPVGDRSLLSSANADYLICNGSQKLIDSLELTGTKHICNVGFFPTMYASSECRDPKSVFVQMTTDREGKEYGSALTRNSLCKWLLDRGYQVNYFEHCYHRDPETIPQNVRRINPGKDYMQTLTRSKYFIGHGTTTPLTNTFVKGAVNICTSDDWKSRQSPVLKNAIDQCCYSVNGFEQLDEAMKNEPRYGEDFSSYLFGTERNCIADSVSEILWKIETNKYR